MSSLTEAAPAAADFYPPLTTPDAPLANAPAVMRYAVAVIADPGALPRLIAEFSKRGLVPDRFEARRVGDDLRVEIAASGLSADLAALLAAKIRAMVLVTEVAASDALA